MTGARARHGGLRGAEMGSERLPAGRSVVLGPDHAAEDAQAVLAALRRPRGRKYKNQPVTVDGHRFDSKAEAARYAELVIAERAGEIRSLEVHPRFPLVVHGISVGDYVGDLGYITKTGEAVVEDVKSPSTRKLPTYRLKAKLVWALYGLTIREIG